MCLNLLEERLSATCHCKSDSFKLLLTAPMLMWGKKYSYTDVSTNTHAPPDTAHQFFSNKVIYSPVYLLCTLCSDLLDILSHSVKFILSFSPLFCHHRLSKARQQRWERGMIMQ